MKPKDYKELKDLLGIEVTAADSGRNVKCPRCWHYHGVIENHDNLCDRCQNVILEYYPDHESAPFIKQALEAQRLKYRVA